MIRYQKGFALIELLVVVAISAMLITALVPFIFHMTPAVAFSFLLGAHVATCFGGSITALLLNVPGTSLSISTC